MKWIQDNIAGLLAVAGALAVFGGQLKSILASVRSWLFISVVQRGRGAIALRIWLRKYGTRVLTGDLEFNTAPWLVQSLGRVQEVLFALPPRQPEFYRVGRRIIAVSGTSWDKEGSCIIRDYVRITTWRPGFNADAFLSRALQEYNTTGLTSRRFKVRHVVGANPKTPVIMTTPLEDTTVWEPADEGVPVGVSLDELGHAAGRVPVSKRCVAHRAYREMHTDVRQWLAAKDWYLRRGIPWRRGYLLYGVPSSGKTMTIMAIAEELDMPVWIFDLGSLSNEELLKNWKLMLTHAPGVWAVFEDFDNVFHLRVNVSGGTLTFDCLLNVLSGAEQTPGVLTAFTTNDVAQIDPALGVLQANGLTTRPGRCDRAIEFTHLSPDERHDVAALYAETPEEVEMFKAAMAQHETLTVAQATDICIRSIMSASIVTSNPQPSEIRL